MAKRRENPPVTVSEYKNGKALDEDGITTELLKVGRSPVLKELKKENYI